MCVRKNVKNLPAICTFFFSEAESVQSKTLDLRKAKKKLKLTFIKFL